METFVEGSQSADGQVCNYIRSCNMRVQHSTWVNGQQAFQIAETEHVMLASQAAQGVANPDHAADQTHPGQDCRMSRAEPGTCGSAGVLQVGRLSLKTFATSAENKGLPASTVARQPLEQTHHKILLKTRLCLDPVPHFSN